MNKKYFICSVALILLVGLCLFFYFNIKEKNSVPSTPEKLTIGIATWPGFAPGFIASQKGFFENLNVEFKIIDDFNARQSAFINGNTQATISTFDSYALESANGIDGKIVMVIDESNGADGIVANDKIKTAKDLIGKKIAYTRGSPAHYFLINYLKKNNIDIKDISRVEVDDPSRAGEAFLSGDVSAAVTWEPFITNIITAKKGHLLENTQSAPNLIVDVMVFNKNYISSNSKNIERFVKGWNKAVEYIKINPHESYEIMAKNLNIPIKEFEGMVAGLKFADLKRNQEIMLPKNNSIGDKIFNEAAQIWLKEKVTSKITKSESHITTEFVE